MFAKLLFFVNTVYVMFTKFKWTFTNIFMFMNIHANIHAHEHFGEHNDHEHFGKHNAQHQAKWRNQICVRHNVEMRANDNNQWACLLCCQNYSNYEVLTVKLCDSSLSSVKSSKFLSDKWPCESLTSVMKSLLIHRVSSASTFSDIGTHFSLQLLDSTPSLLSHRNCASHAPIEPLGTVSIFGGNPYFFLDRSGFVSLCRNFPIPTFSKWPRNSGSSCC